MKIQPISNSMILNNNCVNKRQLSNIKDIKNSPIGDVVSFGGYREELIRAINATFDRESHVERYFSNLVSSLLYDAETIKTPEFVLINNSIKKFGLRNTIKELWNANTSEKFKGIVNKSEDNIIPLVYNKNDNDIENPLFYIINWGRQGFWNGLINNKKAPRDIRLVFSHKSNSLELNLDKKSDLTVLQSSKTSEEITHFHSLTGHKKLVIKSLGIGNSESVYYHKDGTEAFWKTFFLGGIPVEPIY